MSLTLLYRGKNVRFSMCLTKLHWLSAILVFSVISGVVVHLIVTNNIQPDNQIYSLIPQNQRAIVSLENQQFTALTV